MAVATHSVRPTGFSATERRDAWWVAPLVQGLLLATLICYASWAAIQGSNYYVRSAGVRSGRAARARLPRRDRLPLHPPEPPPLCVLHHVRLPLLPLARRVRGGALRERHRHRGRHARAADQHRCAHVLQLLLPLGPPPGGRDPRLLLV